MSGKGWENEGIKELGGGLTCEVLSVGVLKMLWNHT